MWLPDAFRCVGSTPGKRAVNSGDLSDEDIIFSDFTLARINVRNEALHGLSEVTVFKGSPEPAQLNWGGNEEGRKTVCEWMKSSLQQEQHIPLKVVTQPCHLAEPAGKKKKANVFKSSKCLVEKHVQVGGELLLWLWSWGAEHLGAMVVVLQKNCFSLILCLSSILKNKNGRQYLWPRRKIALLPTWLFLDTFFFYKKSELWLLYCGTSL